MSTPSLISDGSDEIITLTREAGDHLAPDHYWRYLPILITDASGKRTPAWLRRWGGSRTNSLSALGARLIETGAVNPATAIF